MRRRWRLPSTSEPARTSGCRGGGRGPRPLAWREDRHATPSAMRTAICIAPMRIMAAPIHSDGPGRSRGCSTGRLRVPLARRARLRMISEDCGPFGGGCAQCRLPHFGAGSHSTGSEPVLFNVRRKCRNPTECNPALQAQRLQQGRFGSTCQLQRSISYPRSCNSLVVWVLVVWTKGSAAEGPARRL